MEPNKIMHADVLDILFEGKNEDYGAYDLRKTYNRRITMAMTGMGAICPLFFLSQLLANNHDKDPHLVKVTDIILDHYKKEVEKPEPPIVKPPKAEPPRVQTIQVTPPVIVHDNEVTDPPPTVEAIEDAHIGLANQDGNKDEGFVAPPVEQSTTVAAAPKKDEEDYERLFIKVEKEAQFPGGMAGWKRYLERNLNASVAADDGAPVGNYAVKVQFVVDKEGNISNVQAIEVPQACPDCGPEAVKVIKRGPKWEPAIQNGRAVNYQAVQYVTFQVAEQ